MNCIPPQAVHVANTWSNLAFWYEEKPNKNMRHFGMETCNSKWKHSSYFFGKIIHFPTEAILFKKAYISLTAATPQGTILIVIKKLVQTKLYTFPKKGIVFYVKQQYVSQVKQAPWKRNVFLKRSKRNAATLQGVLSFVVKKMFSRKSFKDACSFPVKRHVEKGMCFSKAMLQYFKGYL